jgi:hypothetical protein
MRLAPEIIISYSEQWSTMTGYACDECGSAFATMEALAAHYKYAHPRVADKYLKNTPC